MGRGSKRRWSVLKTAVVLRFAVTISIIVADLLVPDYDTSTEIIDSAAGPPISALDEFVRRALRGFSHWDAVYLTHIAQHGYTFEQFQAFFPCLPLAMRGLVNAGPPRATHSSLSHNTCTCA